MPYKVVMNIQWDIPYQTQAKYLVSDIIIMETATLNSAHLGNISVH